MQASQPKKWERWLRSSVSALVLCCVIPCASVANPDMSSGIEAGNEPLKLSPPSAPLPWLVSADAVPAAEDAAHLPMSVAKAHSHHHVHKHHKHAAMASHHHRSRTHGLALHPPHDSGTQENAMNSQPDAALLVLRPPSVLPWLVSGNDGSVEQSPILPETPAPVTVAGGDETNQPTVSEVQVMSATMANTLQADASVSTSGSTQKEGHVLRLVAPSVPVNEAVAIAEPAPTMQIIAGEKTATEYHVETESGVVVAPAPQLEALSPAAGGEPVQLLAPAVTPLMSAAPEILPSAQPKLDLPNIASPVPLPSSSLPGTPLPSAAPSPLPTLHVELPKGGDVTKAPAPAAASQAASVTVAPTPSPMPVPAVEKKLSEESEAIIDNLPPEPVYRSGKKKVKIAHEGKEGKSSGDDVKKRETYGMKLAVRKPKMDVFRTLEAAYNSLIAGDQQYAIALYKEVLEEDQENTLALFGLATTYHRAGQLDLARPLYARLLEIDPQNVEGLNNFLVLLADEAPDEALVALTKLRHTHPGFSPVPAQMALIYQKKGEYARAAEYMASALALSPENLKYQYNMAIIFDKMGDREGAAKWYQQLIAADGRGEKIPGKVNEIQQRLTFIRSNTSSAQ